MNWCAGCPTCGPHGRVVHKPGCYYESFQRYSLGGAADLYRAMGREPLVADVEHDECIEHSRSVPA